MQEDFNIHAKKFLLSVIEEKTTIKRIRMRGGELPKKIIPDIESTKALKEKLACENNESILVLIDDCAEIIFQEVLAGNTEQVRQWVKKYIELIDLFRNASQDTVIIWKFILLPRLLMNLEEEALAKKIIKAMVEKWLKYSIEKYNYYELKANEEYLDYIFDVADNADEKGRYEQIKNSIISNWSGEGHLTQY